MRLAAKWQWPGQGIERAGECRAVVGIERVASQQRRDVGRWQPCEVIILVSPALLVKFPNELRCTQ
ncbi:hypothetical protein J6590_096468 [Homalodisca vitripennis]|nr:hypothetical protein J6590_096468 [Homalodisca vitripennis]